MEQIAAVKISDSQQLPAEIMNDKMYYHESSPGVGNQMQHYDHSKLSIGGTRHPKQLEEEKE